MKKVYRTSLRDELLISQHSLHTRRTFLKMGGLTLGAMAMGTQDLASAATSLAFDKGSLPHFAPKARSVIYLHMAGAPSQLELWDYKPLLEQLHGRPCPESLLEGKKFAFIRGTPKMLGPQVSFQRYGQSGQYLSDHLVHFREVIDEVSFLRAVHTDQFNHAPAQMLMYTGSPILGRPSMGSWVTYGLGSDNENLPGFVVLTSGGAQPDAGKQIWGSGFLPSVYQGVQCRSKGSPVLFIQNPDHINRDIRRNAIEAINEVNQQTYQEFRDDETIARIAQYEMAFQMQMAVPEVMDISKEPAYIHDLYGSKPGQESFANNVLLARKLVENGVRFVQLFDYGWDSHGVSEETALERGFKDKCRDMDRPVTALIKDLKQRGLLDETLVIWGGEFGRTPMQENRNGVDLPYAGRDHHPDAFTIWMAGGGIKAGHSHGATDEIGYHPVEGRQSLFDIQATILHLLGIDHERFTYDFQGRPFRLTDVAGEVIREVVV